MPNFDYKAITTKGKEVVDTVDAENAVDAAKKIRALGYFPIAVVEQGRGKLRMQANQGGGILQMSLGGTVKTREIVAFIRQFSSLMSAGIPLLRSMNILWEQQRPGLFKKTIGEMLISIQAGATLSEALGKYPRIFNRLFVNMVKAGEAAGVLDSVFLRMADYFEKSARLKARIQSALIYPIVVVLAAIAVMLFLVVFIIPKFAAMFADMDLKLPGPTLLLIALSNLWMTWYFWVGLVVVVIAVILLLKAVAATDAGRYKLDQLKLKIPVFGQIVQKVSIARFSRTLGTLISSGVPILRAMVIVKDTIGNEVFARAINNVSESIREGESIADPLRQSPVFSPGGINRIAVGEETGKLDDILFRVADQFDEEVDVLIVTLTTLLEPFLIVTLAVIVGGIVISLFLPMISLISSLSQN